MTPKERAAMQPSQQAVAAMRLALEALELHLNGCGVAIATRIAYDALREALAEQAEPSQLADASLEPVAEWEKLKDPQTLFVNLNRGFPAQLTHGHLLHLLNKTEQVEPSQLADASLEPVAWVEVERGIPMFMDFAEYYKPNIGNGIAPLYAAPVRTKDLTDNEIDDVKKFAQAYIKEN